MDFNGLHLLAFVVFSIFCTCESIVISFFSKDIHLAGERIGYIVTNPVAKKSSELSEWLCGNNEKLGNLSSPPLIQHVLVDVIKTHFDLPTLTNEYRERIDLMHKGLLTAGMESCAKADGGFYLFPKLPSGMDDKSFAMHLVEHGVLVIPGSAFGAPGYANCYYRTMKLTLLVISLKGLLSKV